MHKYDIIKNYCGVKKLLNKKLMVLAIFIVGLLAVSAVSAANNDTNSVVKDANEGNVNSIDVLVVDGDSDITGEVEMPTERLEIKFHDEDKILTYNVFDERLYSGLTDDLNFDYKVNNKSCSSGQGSIYSPTDTRYWHSLNYYEDGEHNLIIHRYNHGTNTLLFNVTFNIENNISLSDDITIQHTKTVKYSIKNGVVSGSFPEEYRTLHEGWNNLTEYSLLNTGLGETKPVILKVFYRPYIINNVDIRTLPKIDENSEDYDEDYDYYDGKEKIKIVVKDIDMYYSPTYGYIVSLVDENGDPVDYADELKVVYSDGDEEIGEFDEDGDYLFDMDKIANRKATFYLTDSYYEANPVTINVKISKSPVKISTKAYYSNTKQYTVLKATVKDSDGEPIDEGKVQFKINNQTYNVTVNNGVAVKKIKLTKAKTYTYNATYLENDHYKKSKTSQNKAYVYSSSKNARTFKIKGYKFTLTQNQYNKLINAKNTGKKLIYKIKTNKKIKQTIKKISYSYKWKYVKTVDLVYAHEKTYYNSNYRYDTIRRHWIEEGVYYQTCKLYKKVEVKKVTYKKLNSRVYAWFGYVLNGQVGHDKYWVEIMTDNSGVVKGKLHWEVKSSTLTGLKTAKPKDKKNFVMI